MKLNKDWLKQNERKIINSGFALAACGIIIYEIATCTPIYIDMFKKDRNEKEQQKISMMEEYRKQSFSFENIKLVQKVINTCNEELKERKNCFKNALEFEKGIGTVHHLTINFDVINDYDYLNSFLDTISFMASGIEDLVIWFNYVDLEKLNPEIASKIETDEMILQHCSGNLEHFTKFKEEGIYLTIKHHQDQITLSSEYKKLKTLTLEDTIYLGGILNCKELEEVELIGGKNKGKNNVLLAEVFNDIEKSNTNLNLKLYDFDLQEPINIPSCKELYISSDSKKEQTLKLNNCEKLSLVGGNYNSLSMNICDYFYMNHCKIEGQIFIQNFATVVCDWNNSRVNMPIEMLQLLNYVTIRNIEAKNIENEYVKVTIDTNEEVIIHDGKIGNNGFKAIVKK